MKHRYALSIIAKGPSNNMYLQRRVLVKKCGFSGRCASLLESACDGSCRDLDVKTRCVWVQEIG